MTERIEFRRYVKKFRDLINSETKVDTTSIKNLYIINEDPKNRETIVYRNGVIEENIVIPKTKSYYDDFFNVITDKDNISITRLSNEREEKVFSNQRIDNNSLSSEEFLMKVGRISKSKEVLFETAYNDLAKRNSIEERIGDNGRFKELLDSNFKKMNIDLAFEYYYAEVQTWDFLKENPRMADLILRQRRSFDENLIILPNVINENRRFRFSFNTNRDIERPGRLYLLDESLDVVIGDKSVMNQMLASEEIDKVLKERFILSAINHEGKQVGTLALLISERLYEAIDLAFARSNNQTLRFSAIAGLLFAAIISLVLTMNMTGPIRKLARGTRSLISGEFKTRVSINNKDELGKLSRDFNILAKTLDKNSESQKQ